MNIHRIHLLALMVLASFTLSACDSTAQMAVGRNASPTVLAGGLTITTVITGSSNATTLSLVAADLPAGFGLDTHPKVVIGSRPTPLAAGPGGSLVTPLAGPPPAPDASNFVTLVLQNDTSSVLVKAKLNPPVTVNKTPATTPAATA